MNFQEVQILRGISPSDVFLIDGDSLFLYRDFRLYRCNIQNETLKRIKIGHRVDKILQNRGQLYAVSGKAVSLIQIEPFRVTQSVPFQNNYIRRLEDDKSVIPDAIFANDNLCLLYPPLEEGRHPFDTITYGLDVGVPRRLEVRHFFQKSVQGNSNLLFSPWNNLTIYSSDNKIELYDQGNSIFLIKEFEELKGIDFVHENKVIFHDSKQIYSFSLETEEIQPLQIEGSFTSVFFREPLFLTLGDKGFIAHYQQDFRGETRRLKIKIEKDDCSSSQLCLSENEIFLFSEGRVPKKFSFEEIKSVSENLGRTLPELERISQKLNRDQDAGIFNSLNTDLFEKILGLCFE